MVKIDLITGFLGAGKTTFIKKYAQYLLDKGMQIGILENDFGAVNVDMMLLQNLMGDNCELEMISGGCDKETHRRRFRTKLISMGMCGYDRVIVEPSGIFDMDEFFDVLRDEPLDQWYEIGNVITIVDAKLEEEMSEEANYLLASEAAYAGRIILSHADEATEEQKSHTIQHLNKALEQIQCKRRLEKEILCKSLPNLSQADFEELLNCGYVMENYRKMDMEEQKGFDSLYFMNENVTEDNIQEIVKKIMDDPECGSVFRVKGFVKNAEDKWLQLNATHNEITMQPIEVGQEVLIVIGEKLQEDKIKSYLKQE
ncbi:GTP-binding protein [Roseburia sp. MSJ-14]|uniref:GTP-binding protein n=1 Tax=Roseburia sp. MSJ-14 TaxID=2841514 RepID=UPI001C119C0B|nr:GTP-binding protein [Roseburia sp. MSJ-14]